LITFELAHVFVIYKPTSLLFETSNVIMLMIDKSVQRENESISGENALGCNNSEPLTHKLGLWSTTI